MPETTARQAREGVTLAKQAAAILRRALARNEPWKGVDEERFQPVKVTAMSTATAWNLPDGSQMIWLDNGAIRTSPRQLTNAEIDELYQRWFNGKEQPREGETRVAQRAGRSVPAAGVQQATPRRGRAPGAGGEANGQAEAM